MAYIHTNKKGQRYFLHSTIVKLRGGDRNQTIYFFARSERSNAVDDVPSGFEVVENKKTGLPVLRRKLH